MTVWETANHDENRSLLRQVRGGKIEADRNLIHLETGPLRVARPEIDLCLGCARALMAWVDEDRDEIDGPEVDAAAKV